jgi:hypothetical protein
MVDYRCEGTSEVTRKFTFTNNVLALNNKGAIFLLAYTLLVLAFSVMIWFVLYKIPDRYGLISKRQERINVNPSGSILIPSGSKNDKSDNQRHASKAITDFISLTKDEDAPAGAGVLGQKNLVDYRKTMQETSLFSGKSKKLLTSTTMDRPQTTFEVTK